MFPQPGLLPALDLVRRTVAAETAYAVSRLQRIVDAAAAGADFVCSGANFLSASHRNMERAGMRVQFVRALWTKAS